MKNRSFGLTLIKSKFTNLPPFLKIECGQKRDSIHIGLFCIKSQEFQQPVLGGLAKFRFYMLALSFLWWFISINVCFSRYKLRII